MDATVSPWSNYSFRMLSDEERQERLNKIISERPEGPLWVFAFGSLMWNPCYEFDKKEVALLNGWERKFHIWTTVARGTPDRPGLGLCLEKGEGECRGIVYRLLPENEDTDWQALWCREMTSGVYKAVWADLETENAGTVRALTFVVDPGHSQYAGELPLDTMSAIMAGACGRYGTCRDYLAGTVEGMEKIGVSDPYLSKLLGLIDRREAEASAG